jgi:hypothetical protein
VLPCSVATHPRLPVQAQVRLSTRTELQANRAAAAGADSSSVERYKVLDNSTIRHPPGVTFPYDFIHMVIFREDQMYSTIVSIHNESNPLLCLEYSI